MLLVPGKICDNNQNYIYSLHLGNALCFLPLLILILVVGLSLCRYESWLSGSVQRGRLQLQELLVQKREVKCPMALFYVKLWHGINSIMFICL